MKRRNGILWLALAGLVLGCAASPQQDARPDHAVLVEHSGVAAFTDTSEALPTIRFADGQTSMNDRCMVRQAKLNVKMPPIYVNQHPVGFC